MDVNVAEVKSYSEFALIDLLDAFASNEPVPGGGSAAALAGAHDVERGVGGFPQG